MVVGCLCISQSISLCVITDGAGVRTGVTPASDRHRAFQIKGGLAVIPRNPSNTRRVKAIKFPTLADTSFLTTVARFLPRRALAVLALGTSLLATWPAQTFADGRIVVGHDVNTLATAIAGDLEETFAINLARWLVGADTGRILLFESATDVNRDYAENVEQALLDAGFEITVTGDVNDPVIANLADFDAVFLGVEFEAGVGLDIIDPVALTEYVRDGGNVYIFGGVGGGADIEAALLNSFLKNFGLAFLPIHNGIIGVPIDSTHPIFEGIAGETLGSNNGSSIILCEDTNAPPDCITNDGAKIVQFFERPGGPKQAVYAVVGGPRPSLDHLTCYNIKRAPGSPKFEKREVIIRNQFGEQAFIVGNPKMLCVPSEKELVQ